MSAELVATWVDPNLVDWLRVIGERQPHAPSLTLVAARAIQAALETIAQGQTVTVKCRARPGGPRRTFSFNLAPSLCRRVEALRGDLPDAGSMSSTLNMLLWIGVNDLLGEEEVESGQAA